MAAETIPSVLEQAAFKEQTTFDTWIAMAGTDAVCPVRGTFKIEPTVAFEKLKEACGTKSNQGEIKLNQGGKFTGQFYVKPAALGTPPDIGVALLKAAMGVETVTPATSVVYTLSDTVKTFLQGVHHIEGHWQRTFSGGVVEQLKITIPSNGLPIFEVSGSFARMGWVNKDVNEEIEAAGIAEIAVADASRWCVGAPAEVTFENDAAQYVVTGTDNTSGAAHFDITPVLAAGIGAGEALTPYAPAKTTGGTVISAVNNVLTFGAVSLGFQQCVVTLITGFGLEDKEGSSDRAVGVTNMAERSVETEWTFYAKDSAAGNLNILQSAHDGETYDIDLSVNNTAAGRMKLSWPKARVDVSKQETSEGDVVMATAKTIARQSAAAADEFSITFD